jgi:nucleoside-diphosphate-sugar epimerase
MAGKHAFVTGATGFVGLNLVEVLAEQGWEVTALHRPTSKLETLRSFPVQLVEGCVTDRESLLRAIPEGVDAVFHVAASTSMWSPYNAEQTRINVGGTRNVIEAALARGTGRLVHTSTIGTYGFHPQKIDESAPQLGAFSWINYLRTKALAEAEIRAGIERGLEAVILNPAHVIGRYDRHNWARLIAMVHSKRLPGVPPGAGSFGHGREVARAHVAAAEHGRPGANYLLGGVDATFLEFIACVGEVTSRPVPRRPAPAILWRIIGHLSLLWSYLSRREPDITPEAAAIACVKAQCSSRLAEQELGYRQVPLRVMIEDSYNWMAAEGLLE